MLEALAILGFPTPALAAPDVVVTLDNGEFNLPFFTPRWNGKWERPSAAQELVAAVARVSGENPRTWTYLPPDQGRLGPGGTWPVEARRAACVGPAETAADPCFCGPGDNCWSGVRPNWYAGASTSLWLTAANVRRALDPTRPRIEVHVTDLFEEDPASAADPKDSDRCVTADGVRRAFSALLTDAGGGSLDHVALGLLRTTADPPPPGGSWGDLYQLGADADGSPCHRGVRTREWSSRAGPWRGDLVVIVLGFGTDAEDESVSSFLDGLVGQLDTDGFEIELARLREPPAHLTARRSLTATELGAGTLELQGTGRRPALPCGTVATTVSLTDPGGLTVPVAAEGRCDGSLSLTLSPRERDRAFLRSAGLDPSRDTLALQGSAELTGSIDALRERWVQVSSLNEGDRPVPLWTALEPVLFDAEGAAARPWRAELAVTELVISEVDGRPWGLAALLGGVTGSVGGMAMGSVVRRLHADRALRRHWTRSLGTGRDPRLQVPLASVLGAAQEEVARSWPLRVAVGTVVGATVALILAAAILVAYLVLLG